MRILETFRGLSRRTEILCTAVEIAAVARWLVAEHQKDYIVLYTDNPHDPVKYTGGMEYVLVKPCSASYGVDGFRFTARPTEEHWDASAHINAIRGITFGDMHYRNVEHSRVVPAGRGAEMALPERLKKYLLPREQVHGETRSIAAN